MITLIKAPSNLGLRPTGIERLPDTLQEAGLAEQLDIKQIETVLPPAYDSHRDPVTNMLNPQAIADYSIALADVVQKTLQSDGFPLVLGGDCSIILGNMLALRRDGRYGLFFMDGHADFYQPSASITGEAADMDLALASGRGPDLVTNLEGLKPLVQDADIVQFGQRDKEITIAEGSQQLTDTDIQVFELKTIRQKGLEASCETALSTLKRQPLEGFWVHIDADVINDNEMPAVDYRLSDGLTFSEVHTVLQRVLASGRVVGISLGIYNPTLDPKGIMAAKLVSLLTGVLKDYKSGTTSVA